MANIIIKTDEQREREKTILRDFGYSGENASAEEREYAETAARRISEAYKEMEAKQR